MVQTISTLVLDEYYEAGFHASGTSCIACGDVLGFLPHIFFNL